GQALIAGPRIIAEVRDRFPGRVLAWITDDSQSPPADESVEWYLLSKPLLKESAHPFHPKSSRAAGTALFQVPLHEGPSIQELASRHVPLIALDTSGP